MKTKKNNTCFGRYPACDLCNNALRFILAGKPDIAEAVRQKMGWELS